MGMLGEVIYSYFYDIADRIDFDLLIKRVKDLDFLFLQEKGKNIPEGIKPFEFPLILNLNEENIALDRSILRAKIQAIIYSVGAIGIRIRIPIYKEAVKTIEDLTFSRKFEDKTKEIALSARRNVDKLLSRYIKIKEKDTFETYRVYFLKMDPNEFIDDHRKWIAGILLNESKFDQLSDEYVDKTLARKLSYYSNDAIFVDWDATFIISNSDNYEDELITIDTSNIQLLEYRVYQKEVDKMIDSINDKLKNLQVDIWKILLVRRNLIKLSTDISDFYTEYKSMIDDVNKIIMSFGDWYIARLYSLLSDSFKLRDIEFRLEETFDMLIRIRDFINDQVSEDTSSFLEFIVILLFVIEIILIIIPLILK